MYAEVYQRELARWVTDRELKEMEAKERLLRAKQLSQEASSQPAENQEAENQLLTNGAGSVEVAAGIPEADEELAEAVSCLAIESEEEDRVGESQRHKNWGRQRAVSGLGALLQQLKGSGDSSDKQQQLPRYQRCV
jgi:hypothetical protein